MRQTPIMHKKVLRTYATLYQAEIIHEQNASKTVKKTQQMAK